MVQMSLTIKSIKKYFSVLYQTGPTTQGWLRRGTCPSTFLCCKNKNVKQKKKESFKAETIRRLSPKSKCYCFGNVYCFILKYLEFKYFSVFHDPLHFEIHFTGPNKSSINVCSTSPKAVWGACWVVFSCTFYYLQWLSFLFIFSAVCLKHVSADVDSRALGPV